LISDILDMETFEEGGEVAWDRWRRKDVLLVMRAHGAHHHDYDDRSTMQTPGDHDVVIMIAPSTETLEKEAEFDVAPGAIGRHLGDGEPDDSDNRGPVCCCSLNLSKFGTLT
jgi:hypothetical protein